MKMRLKLSLNKIKEVTRTPIKENGRKKKEMKLSNGFDLRKPARSGTNRQTR